MRNIALVLVIVMLAVATHGAPYRHNKVAYYAMHGEWDNLRQELASILDIPFATKHYDMIRIFLPEGASIVDPEEMFEHNDISDAGHDNNQDSDDKLPEKNGETIQMDSTSEDSVSAAASSSTY